MPRLSFNQFIRKVPFQRIHVRYISKFPSDFTPQNIIASMRRKRVEGIGELRERVYETYLKSDNQAKFTVCLDGFHDNVTCAVETELKDLGFGTQFIPSEFFRNEFEPAKLIITSK